jgi:hypothetical protein
MIYGIDRTTHGNYVCPFCPKRKMMKTLTGMEHHVENDHKHECELWEKDERIRQADAARAVAERKLQVYTEQAKSKPKQSYYNATVFCTHCKKLADCGMPMGTLASNVTCPHCGIIALHLVVNVSYWR